MPKSGRWSVGGLAGAADRVSDRPGESADAGGREEGSAGEEAAVQQLQAGVRYAVC